MKSIFEQNGGTDCHGCKPFKALISCFAEVKAYFQLYSPRTGSKFSLQLCVEIWSAGGRPLFNSERNRYNGCQEKQEQKNGRKDGADRRTVPLSEKVTGEPSP